VAGLWVLLAVLVGATVFGVWWSRSSGRIRPVHGIVAASVDDPEADIEPAAPDDRAVALRDAVADRLGPRATVVQISTAFCAPCRATRRIIEEVVAMVPGVAHIEIDAEDNLALVRALDVRRTPTVMFLDGSGTLRRQASGQPRKADVIAALGDVIAT
jgi:thiol-disulfide isomerase/thioredoxin